MPNDDFDATKNIVVFIALAEEYDVFLSSYPARRSIDDAEHIISEHEAPASGFRLISILSKGMGIDNAYDAVTAAIKRCKPDMVVCLGIAGSLSGDMKVGDIAISGEIIDVSQNMKISERTILPKRRHGKSRSSGGKVISSTVIELSPKTYNISAPISASFRFVRSHPNLKASLAAWEEGCAERRNVLAGAMGTAGLQSELEVPPVAEIGPIISGPVVASSAFRDVLKRLDRKVLAIETESAGMFRACAAANIPSVTIRGISDHADLGKNALERTTKAEARRLAMQNAIEYFRIQLSNPTFMRIPQAHAEDRDDPQLFGWEKSEPDVILRRVASSIDCYLEKMSPEYKHRPNGTNLPIPRVSLDYVDDEIDDIKQRMPRDLFDAIKHERRIYLKIPKSFPNQTLAWSIAQKLLLHEIDGRQILPLVLSGEELIPPQKGIKHATSVDPKSAVIRENFCPVIIISEPQFHLESKIDFFISQVNEFSEFPVIVVSRAEDRIEEIERVKGELSLVDHSTAPVPFHEIANYLESAFEMKPEEADSVATRLDDTFSKFRLHTHPAYL
jgi:nucleoside phosphorylase